MSAKYWSISAGDAQGRDYEDLFVHFLILKSIIWEKSEEYLPWMLYVRLSGKHFQYAIFSFLIFSYTYVNPAQCSAVHGSNIIYVLGP